MEIVKIKASFKDYSWGSRDTLPALFHYDAGGRPQAEAWFGVHPDGSSTLEDGTPFIDYLSSNPERLLGKGWEGYMERFPLTLKVLAVHNPLSLHVHPDNARAAQGWKDEEPERARGVGRASLVFKDPNGKSEVFRALTPTTVLCGLRDFDSVERHLRRLLPKSADAVLGSSRTVRGVFKNLLTMEEGRAAPIAEEFLASLADSAEEMSRSGVFFAERGIAERIYSVHGPEASVLAPYLMNVTHLGTGEALRILPGTIHSIIRGTGIEIEDSSDNEARLGMTDKPRNLKLALQIADFDDTSAPEKSLAVQDRFLRQVIDCGSYKLATLPSGAYDIREDVPSLAFCAEGQARVGTSSDHVMLREGECCFIPSSDEEYHVRVAGKVFQAIFP